MKKLRLVRTVILFASVFVLFSCETDEEIETVLPDTGIQEEFFNSFTSVTPVENGVTITLPSGTISHLSECALNREIVSDKEIQEFLHKQFIDDRFHERLNLNLDVGARLTTNPNSKYIQLISAVTSGAFEDIVVFKEVDYSDYSTAIATKRTTSGLWRTVARASVYYYETNEYNFTVNNDFLAFESKNTNGYTNGTFHCSDGGDEKARGYANWNGSVESYRAYVYIKCDD